MLLVPSTTREVLWHFQGSYVR